jgi:integrase
VPLDELGAIYEACRVALWPRGFGISPIVWWRCLLAFQFNLGFRTNDLLSREWTHVRKGSRELAGCSKPDVTYITLVPKKTRRKKPAALYLPCNATVMLHMQALNLDRRQLFPKPGGTGRFYATWKSIQQAAGIADVYELQHIRATCNTALNRIRPGIGDWVLGHGKRKSVNAEYYTQIEEDLLEVLPLLRQPEQLLAGPSSSKQLRLF